MIYNHQQKIDAKWAHALYNEQNTIPKNCREEWNLKAVDLAETRDLVGFSLDLIITKRTS